MTDPKCFRNYAKSGLTLLALAVFHPAAAEPINNSGLSPQECYQKDSGCTQFCGEVTGDLRYECFGICDRMLDRCLDTGDWTDSVRVDPGFPPRPNRIPVLSATLLQMVMTLADTDGDGKLSDGEIKALKDKVYKGQVAIGTTKPQTLPGNP